MSTNVDTTTTCPISRRASMTAFTGRGTTIKYTLDDLIVEVPNATGENAPRATWRFHGTVAISTTESGS